MFEIFKSEKGDKFYFRLKAKNGQVILSSQGYATKASAKNGVESVMKNAGNDDLYERKEAANGKFHFNLLASNKQVIGSSQMYASKASMENGINSIKSNAPGATVKDLTVEG
ncbi:MAG: YegP family protein [Phaeodactylibacter sp.]|nr:YegP family protein [Phaeodactylibacter sp.]MCB9264147.1 YegP family protein [Lewinellaceae bacterium]MCB9286767.1 YegP family protein [Lewinellaceae bacterium]